MSSKVEAGGRAVEDYLEYTSFPASSVNYYTQPLNSSYEYHSNTTGQCKWNPLNTGMTLMLLLTFILNALASIVLFRVPLVSNHGRSNPVYFCIRFLNACDVLQAFVLMLMPAFATSDCGWLGGNLSCSMMGFIVLFFLLVSPLITILMAFDRVVALYWPFKYRSNLGLRMLKVLLPSACILVLVTTVLPVFGVGEYHVVKGRRFCLLDTITEDSVNRSYVIAVHVIFLFALLFMLSCTIAFQTKLASMSFTKKHKESKSKNKRRNSSKRTRNATLTTMAVCSIFIVCYLPYVIRVLVEATTLQKSGTIVTWMTFGLAFVQPLLNPVVYIATNTRYRKEFQSLVRNIKAAEWETSSESGQTQHGSKGPLSGFRRRLSSGSSRNSKRGGSKRKHLEGRNSQNNSATSPHTTHFVGNGEEKRSSLQRQSKTPAFVPDNTFKGGKITTRKKSLGASPKPGNSHKYREPSSSSGVKSYDSVEKMLLSAPAMASSLAFQISNGQKESAEYGRSTRGLSGSSEPKARERSNTVSGLDQPQRELANCITSRCVSKSTPELLSDLDCSETVQHPFNDLHGGGGSTAILKYDHSPMKWPHAGREVPQITTDEPTATFLMANGGAVQGNGTCDSATKVDGNLDDSEVEETLTQHPGVNRSLNRPSYKRALDITSRYLLSRKPSKRDSGVGEP